MLVDLAALSFPNIDPVLIEIGPLAIRWYALSYIAGILLGYIYMRRLDGMLQTRLLTPKQYEDLMFWAILGIMLGGRMGYVMFYNANYYLEYPLDALKIWQGGMSFHGGLMGMGVITYLFAKKQSVSFLKLMDRIACAAPIGLFFGRLANFINGELYGRPSDVGWAMVFPMGGPEPRHPSQLYEAGLEGALLFAVLWFLARTTNIHERAGALTGLFLIGYGAARSFVELFRQPDAQLGFIIGEITMGQLLCLPMILLGLYLVVTSKHRIT